MPLLAWNQHHPNVYYGRCVRWEWVRIWTKTINRLYHSNNNNNNNENDNTSHIHIQQYFKCAAEREQKGCKWIKSKPNALANEKTGAFENNLSLLQLLVVLLALLFSFMEMVWVQCVFMHLKLMPRLVCYISIYKAHSQHGAVVVKKTFFFCFTDEIMWYPNVRLQNKKRKKRQRNSS